jgi:nucleoside-diphosphate-sugar epimerase
MKILVVGGAGFIGHHVIKRLQDRGHECIVLDNYTDYGILEPVRHQQLIFKRLDYIGDPGTSVVDISEYGKVESHIGKIKPDVIIHLASFPRAKVVNNNPLNARVTMIDGTENLLMAAKNFNVKRFVYISSSMIYGDFIGGVTEDAPAKPGSIYATYKLAGEQLTKHYADEYTIVRPSAVYGPRDVEDRVVSKFFAEAMKGGVLNVNGELERLDFSYIDDVANGITLAATHENAANETFNITYGQDETIMNAARAVVDIVGKGTINIRSRNPNMPSRGYLDITKAETLLDYNPQIDMYTGFEMTYDWLKNPIS